MIHTMNTYHIKVRGKVEESDFNPKSPLHITVIQTDLGATLFTLCTDQSGLIGLLRHLHGQGFVLLSVHRHADEIIPNKEDSSNE